MNPSTLMPRKTEPVKGASMPRSVPRRYDSSLGPPAGEQRVQPALRVLGDQPLGRGGVPGPQRPHEGAVVAVPVEAEGAVGRDLLQQAGPPLGAGEDAGLREQPDVPLETEGLTPDQLAASFFHSLGIDHQKEYHTISGRPIDPRDWPLLVVNGVALGRRPDGTVDHALAQCLFRLIDCAEWFAVNFVKADEALKRFGPGADRDAMLFLTMPSSATVWTPRR